MSLTINIEQRELERPGVATALAQLLSALAATPGYGLKDADPVPQDCNPAADAPVVEEKKTRKPRGPNKPKADAEAKTDEPSGDTATLDSPTEGETDSAPFETDEAVDIKTVKQAILAYAQKCGDPAKAIAIVTEITGGAKVDDADPVLFPKIIAALNK